MTEKKKVPVLAETPVTQHSPYNSAVSASLMNLYQQVLIIYHFATPLPHSLDQYFTAAAISMLQHFTAESSRELMSSEEYCSVLKKLNNKQRPVVMFLLLPFKLFSQLPLPFSLFSLFLCPLSAPFLNPLSFSFPQASLTSLLSLLINSLSS